MAGSLREIVISKEGKMFAIGKERVRSSFRILRFDNGRWRKMPGSANRIAVDS
jgi:hypothetical protein